MMEDVNEKKNRPYPIDLQWEHNGLHVKRLYLAGEDSQEGEKEFRNALGEVEVLGDSAKSWAEFLDGSIEIFRKHGFFRVDY